MKVKFIWIFAIVTIGLVATLAIIASRRAEKEEKEVAMGKSKIKAPTRVDVLLAKPSNIVSKLSVSGTLVAMDQVELRPETQGNITALFFDDGDRVTKGQLLVSLNNIDLQAQLRKSQFQLELASQTEQRLQKLASSGGISKQEYDIAVADKKSKQAELDLIKAQISKTQIRAPFSGTIGLRSISVGAYASPQTSLATLQNIDQLKLDFYIPEAYANLVAVGSKVTFIAGGSTAPVTAKVIALDPRVDVNTRQILVRALVPNAKHTFLPGSFAEVKIEPTQARISTISVPTQSVIPELKRSIVYVAKGGVAVPKEVKIGLRNDSTIQILSGLQLGDSVIYSGVLYMRPQAPISVTSVK